MFWVIFDNPGVKQEHFSSKMFKLQSDNSDQPKDRNLYSMVVILFVSFCFVLFLLLLLSFVNPGAMNWGFSFFLR